MEQVGRDLDVFAAVGTLLPRMRRVCELFSLEDRSVRDIASILGIGIGIGTVKTQLHRGRVALASRLAD